MTHTVQRGLDAPLGEEHLARIAAQRQRAKAVGLPLDASIAEIERAERSVAAGHRAVGRPAYVPTETVTEPNCNALFEWDSQTATATVREKQVEHAGDRLMQSCGFTVIRMSQRRRSKVHVGLPDRLYTNPLRRLAVWWEAKAPGGKRSPAQVQFEADVAGCGYGYVTGGVQALREWLTRTLEARP